MESYSVSNDSSRVLDINVVSLSLSVISNNNGLLIQSKCNRTEYLCGPLCVRLIVKGAQLNLIRLVALLLHAEPKCLCPRSYSITTIILHRFFSLFFQNLTTYYLSGAPITSTALTTTTIPLARNNYPTDINTENNTN